MRALSPELRARLDAEATSFCQCWRLIRRDGAVIGFTDHDCDLIVGGVVHAARAGLDATRGETALGFAAAGGEVDGVLVAEGLNEDDLAAGLYDGATVETWLVDWADIGHRLLVSVDTIGEVRRSENAFTAELRSLAHKLDQEQGRLYQTACSADLGDARCGLSSAEFETAGMVVALRNDGAFVVEVGAYPDDWFAAGACVFSSGAASGRSLAIRAHRAEETRACLTPWGAPPQNVAVGDRVVLKAGCDKQAKTCREKFGNFPNFRGFPHIPGDDALFNYPKPGDARLDGGSLFR